jgi:hypothetical protein
MKLPEGRRWGILRTWNLVGLEREQPLLCCPSAELSAIGEPHLAENVREVVLPAILGDKELRDYAAVRKPPRH